MNCARTSEIAVMPKVFKIIEIAIKNTSQNTSLPRIETGVWLLWLLSKSCFMPPFSIQPSKRTLLSTLVVIPCKTLAMICSR